MKKIPAITRSIVLLFFLLSITHKIFAQEKRPIFLGLQPSYTAEQFYEENELDINVIPLMMQFPVAKLIDIRFVTIVNYHIGGMENGFSDIGLQFVMPIYFKKKEQVKSPSGGFYAAPVIGLGRNIMNDHYTLTLAAEAGYMFPAKKSFSLALGLQFGATYFDYDNQPNVWRNHFGFKVNIGFWVNKG